MKYATKYYPRFVGAVALQLISLAANAEPLDSDDAKAQSMPVEECLLQSMKTAAPDTTIGELRTRCQQIFPDEAGTSAQHVPAEQMTPVQRRMFDDQISYNRDFAISAFQPNYLLGTYSTTPNEEPFDPLYQEEDALDNAEVKFQVSIKAPLWQSMFGTNNDLIAAYTSTSWWQLRSNSSVFRETDYQPELFLRHYGGPAILGGRIVGADIGLNHQSNGRDQELSRGWGRVMGRLYLDYGDIAVALRVWYRLPESKAEDDNPGMYRYYGYGDVLIAYAPNKNTFTAMLRPGTQEHGLELTWSYPFTKSIRAYAQYWNGYGESLLDYDAHIERFGIGFALNDWLQRR